MAAVLIEGFDHFAKIEDIKVETVDGPWLLPTKPPAAILIVDEDGNMLLRREVNINTRTEMLVVVDHGAFLVQAYDDK